MGFTTRLAERLLETGAVDAVMTMAPDSNNKWQLKPVNVSRAEGMTQCWGMRMGYALLITLLEPVLAMGCRRLAVIGIPCHRPPHHRAGCVCAPALAALHRSSAEWCRLKQSKLKTYSRASPWRVLAVLCDSGRTAAQLWLRMQRRSRCVPTAPEHTTGVAMHLAAHQTAKS